MGPISLFLNECLGLLEFVLEWILASFLGCEVIRLAAGSRTSDAEQDIQWKRFTIQDLIYFLLACILYILYILPGLWWMLVSSLSSVLFVIADMGLAGSFSRSRELIKGHFWEVVRYLLPVTLLIVLPSCLIPDGVEYFLDNELENWSYSFLQIALLMGYLVATIISWSCWLASLSYLLRLCEFLKQSQDSGYQLDC